MLAVSDFVSISMWAINLVVSAAISIAVYRVSATTRKFENLEGSRKAEVDSLTSKLHDTATKLIDERFRAITHELNTHVQGFTTALDLMKEQLSDGQDGLHSLDERNRSIERAVEQRCENIKDAIRETCATKDDLLRHEDRVEKKFAHTDEKVSQVREMVAGISARLGVLGVKESRNG